MMQRRDMIKRSALAAGALVISPLALTACSSTAQLVRWTGAIIGLLKDLSPILTQMGQGTIVALVARAIPIAEQLKKAFEDNNHTDALTFLSNLTAPDGLIVQIADQIKVLQGEKRVILLGIMASIQVVLRLIAANIAEEVPADAVTKARDAAPKAVANVERASAPNALEAAFAASKF